MVAKPDHTVRHPINRCSGCGRSLAKQAPDRIERRQVFDLPEPKLEVTEHQAGLAALPAADLDRFYNRYLRIVQAGYTQNPAAEPSGRTPTSGPEQAEQSP